METLNYIPIKTFCTLHNIPVSFIYELHSFQLIEIISLENDQFLYENQIKDLEKWMRLHFELEINLEGLDAIHHLLKQVESLQKDIMHLNNKLNRFERLL